MTTTAEQSAVYARRIMEQDKQIAAMREALQLCAGTLDMFLNQSGPKEIRDSFQREVTALKAARAALAQDKEVL